MTIKNSFEFVRIILLLHETRRWKVIMDIPSTLETGRQRETMEKMVESHESFVIYVHGELGRLVNSTNFVPPTKL